MITDISAAHITPEALARFWSIEAVTPGGDRKVLWDPRRLIPFSSRGSPGTLIENAQIMVAVLDDETLDPIRAAIKAAGGERELCL